MSMAFEMKIKAEMAYESYLTALLAEVRSLAERGALWVRLSKMESFDPIVWLSWSEDLRGALGAKGFELRNDLTDDDDAVIDADLSWGFAQEEEEE